MQILACPPPAHQGKALTAPAAHPVCPGSQSTSPSGALHQGPGPAWLAPWEGRCPSEPHLLPRKMGPGGPEGYGELQINQPAPSDGRIGPALCLRARARAHTGGGFLAPLAGAQRPARSENVPPAPSSRAWLAPPPAPPGRAVLGAAARHVLRRCRPPSGDCPQAAQRESKAPITGTALYSGSGPGSSLPPTLNRWEGLGSPGGGAGEQEQPWT